MARREKATVETRFGFRSMVDRFVRTYRKRVAVGDMEDLAAMAESYRLFGEELGAAVRDLHGEGYSWAEIGRALGVPKQTAHRRYGLADGEREAA